MPDPGATDVAGLRLLESLLSDARQVSRRAERLRLRALQSGEQEVAELAGQVADLAGQVTGLLGERRQEARELARRRLLGELQGGSDSA